MVTLRPNGPVRGSASSVRLGLPQLMLSSPHCSRLWAALSAWNAQGRGMCRAAQPARAAGGSEADPGAARSRPPRRPL
jgi:hypothetical protein